MLDYRKEAVTTIIEQTSVILIRKIYILHKADLKFTCLYIIIFIVKEKR